MITNYQLSRLDLVLNEARLREVYLHEQRRLAQVWLDCLTLTPTGDEPDDPLVCIRLNGLTRIAASLRNAPWDDASAPAIPFELSELSEIIRSFAGQDLYGWEYFNLPDTTWAHWQDRLSLDTRLPGPGGSHSLRLFQDADARHLDLIIWFEDLWVTRQDGSSIDADELCQASRRWWDAMYAGDPRVAHHGIVAAGQPTAPKPTRWPSIRRRS